jgi:hypothetical protein
MNTSCKKSIEGGAPWNCVTVAEAIYMSWFEILEKKNDDIYDEIYMVTI